MQNAVVKPYIFVLVESSPGSGKTDLMKQVEYQFLNNSYAKREEYSGFKFTPEVFKWVTDRPVRESELESVEKIKSIHSEHSNIDLSVIGDKYCLGTNINNNRKLFDKINKNHGFAVNLERDTATSASSEIVIARYGLLDEDMESFFIKNENELKLGFISTSPLKSTELSQYLNDELHIKYKIPKEQINIIHLGLWCSEEDTLKRLRLRAIAQDSHNEKFNKLEISEYLTEQDAFLKNTERFNIIVENKNPVIKENKSLEYLINHSTWLTSRQITDAILLTGVSYPLNRGDEIRNSEKYKKFKLNQVSIDLFGKSYEELRKGAGILIKENVLADVATTSPKNLKKQEFALTLAKTYEEECVLKFDLRRPPSANEEIKVVWNYARKLLGPNAYLSYIDDKGIEDNFKREENATIIIPGLTGKIGGDSFKADQIMINIGIRKNSLDEYFKDRPNWQNKLLTDKEFTKQFLKIIEEKKLRRYILENKELKEDKLVWYFRKDENSRFKGFNTQPVNSLLYPYHQGISLIAHNISINSDWLDHLNNKMKLSTSTLIDYSEKKIKLFKKLTSEQFNHFDPVSSRILSGKAAIDAHIDELNKTEKQVDQSKIILNEIVNSRLDTKNKLITEYSQNSQNILFPSRFPETWIESYSHHIDLISHLMPYSNKTEKQNYSDILNKYVDSLVYVYDKETRIPMSIQLTPEGLTGINTPKYPQYADLQFTRITHLAMQQLIDIYDITKNNDAISLYTKLAKRTIENINIDGNFSFAEGLSKPDDSTSTISGAKALFKGIKLFENNPVINSNLLEFMKSAEIDLRQKIYFLTSESDNGCIGNSYVPGENEMHEGFSSIATDYYFLHYLHDFIK